MEVVFTSSVFLSQQKSFMMFQHLTFVRSLATKGSKNILTYIPQLAEAQGTAKEILICQQNPEERKPCYNSTHVQSAWSLERKLPSVAVENFGYSEFHVFPC